MLEIDCEEWNLKGVLEHWDPVLSQSMKFSFERSLQSSFFFCENIGL